MPEPAAKPPCFGDLDTVFPTGADGLRHSPPRCCQCHAKTACLRTAIRDTNARVIKNEQVDRAYEAGAIGFWERWLQKKSLHLAEKQARSIKTQPQKEKTYEQNPAA